VLQTIGITGAARLLVITGKVVRRERSEEVVGIIATKETND
jgi:hypothetical protein